MSNSINHDKQNSSKWKAVKNSFSKYENVWVNQGYNKTIPDTINLSIFISSFCVNNICLLETKINKIVDGTFTSMIYSDTDSVYNGVYLKIPIQDLIPYMKRGNTYMIANTDIVQELINIENEIIDYYRKFFQCDKIGTKIIQHQFESRSIKISNETDPKRDDRNKKYYLLKISGIWETNSNIGITIKFLE